MPTVIMSPTVEDWNSLCCLKGQDQEQYVEIMGNISYFDIEEEVSVRTMHKVLMSAS